MIRFSILSVLLLAMLSGCGEVVVFGHVVREAPTKTAAADPTPATAPSSAHAAPESNAPVAAVPRPTAAHVVRAVNLTFSPEAKASNASIAADALLNAIRTELRSRRLLDEQNPHAAGTAEILIDDATTHPTVNAVVFGRQMMAGMLTGDVHVSSANGEALPTAKIVAESRLSIATDGSDPNPLGPLYRRFAVLTADTLAGVASEPSESQGYNGASDERP